MDQDNTEHASLLIQSYRICLLVKLLQQNRECRSPRSSQGDVGFAKSFFAAYLPNAILCALLRLLRIPLLHLPVACLGLYQEQVPLLPVRSKNCGEGRLYQSASHYYVLQHLQGKFHDFLRMLIVNFLCCYKGIGSGYHHRYGLPCKDKHRIGDL